MKTKSFNYFRNAFALIGFFIIACSVATTDEPTVEPEPPVQSNNGKYQIVQHYSNYFVVLNTASGSVKQFKANTSTGVWEDQNINGTFTH
tara:strand:+ start:158 stop:427 length:270 start_codon:yes stop_codon:yes gene_type:complete